MSPHPAVRALLPWSGLLLLPAWELAVRLSHAQVLPGPGAVARGLAELLVKGVLHQHVVASLFRVTWGYLLAVAVAVPLGLLLGSSRRGEMAFGPLLQVLRPISPLAWIPIAILWFGVGDAPAIFIIFVACALPLTLSVSAAVHGVPEVHLRAGRNFGLSGAELLRRVVLPAALPQVAVGLRLALGIAWLVVVAAEMIAVRSGLGFLIVDSRNAGDRYDLVAAGMVLIGVIGLLLDTAVRRLDGALLARAGRP
jgi:NitT/TauT family transport system permease protein